MPCVRISLWGAFRQKSIRRAFRALAVAVVALAPLAVIAPGAVAQISDVFIPPVMKVDPQGKRIDGAAWNFTICKPLPGMP